jgi:histone demethylase JARID1
MTKSIPLSALESTALDLSTVERKVRKDSPKANRPYGLQDAPTYRPTRAEFKDPAKYIRSIEKTACQFGIVKIVPPDDWQPPIATDTKVSADSSTASHIPREVSLTSAQRFHFRARRQKLNSLDGGIRMFNRAISGWMLT